MIGIIYKYTSPDGKIYIGQTVNESKRRFDFLNVNKKYAGGKINRARKQFSPKAFKYEILYKNKFNNYRKAKFTLNLLERKYIKKFDSFHSGLNGNFGGSNFAIDNLFIFLFKKLL